MKEYSCSDYTPLGGVDRSATATYFSVDTSGVFQMDTSLIGKSYSEINTLVGGDLPAQKDFTWWGNNLKNVDYVYGGVSVCLMSQDDILVMAMYDSSTSMESSALAAAEKQYGSFETNGTTLTVDVNSSCYLEMLEEVYADTGETVFRQRYVSNNMK